jgi:hypothetical protein
MRRLRVWLLSGIVFALAAAAVASLATPPDALACNPKVERC